MEHILQHSNMSSYFQVYEKMNLGIIEIPKNSSTSTRLMIGAAYSKKIENNWSEGPPQWVRTTEIKDVLEQRNVLILYRDPIDRYISAYKNIYVQSHLINGIQPELNIEEYLYYLIDLFKKASQDDYNAIDAYIDNEIAHFIPQSWFYYNDTKIIDMKNVTTISYRNMKLVRLYLEKIYPQYKNINFPIPHTNSSSGTDIAQYMNVGTKLLHKIWRDNFYSDLLIHSKCKNKQHLLLNNLRL